MGLSLVFLFYLSGVLAVTGIRRPFGFFPRLALVPFVDMIKGPVDTTLNVLLFLPLGVFLPILYAEFDGIRQIALCAFALSLAIELMQMFGLGITDVNDLMTTTAGACLGLSFTARFGSGRTRSKKRSCKHIASRESRFCCSQLRCFFL